MKRTISFLLMLSLLCFTAGCTQPYEADEHTANTQDTSVLSAPETTGVALPTDTDSLHVPLISISMPTVCQSEYAADGTEIFRYTYPNISLVLPDPETADSIIVRFLNHLDKMSDSVSAVKSAAKADNNTDDRSLYVCQINYNTTRIDQNVLSLFGTYSAYNGNPHPEAVNTSISYNLTSGEEITLEGLLEPSASELLVNEIIRSLNAQIDELHLFEDFADTVRDRFKSGLSQEKDWYFSNIGLCFYFSPYDIAPYSAGTVIAEVPYDALTGSLDDAYFPRENETGSGTIKGSLFNEKLTENFDNFSEVIINKGAIKAMLHTDATIYDLRIESGSWTPDGNSFIPEQTVYAAYALTPNDAIIVESEIPDTLPRLRITYKSEGQFVTRYLTDSGMDGSIILT